MDFFLSWYWSTKTKVLKVALLKSKKTNFNSSLSRVVMMVV